MANSSDQYVAGAPCFVQWAQFDAEARPFVRTPCVVVKRTKAGLILIALRSDPTKTYPFAQRDVTLGEYVPPPVPALPAKIAIVKGVAAVDAQGMMQRGLARIHGRRKAFWRGCMCGAEFFAIGRKRKVTRRLAEVHVQRCREKALLRAEGMSVHG